MYINKAHELKFCIWHLAGWWLANFWIFISTDSHTAKIKIAHLSGSRLANFGILILTDSRPTKIQIALFERRRLANFWIFIFTGSRPVKTLFKKGRLTWKKYFYEKITNGYIHSNYFRAGREEIYIFKMTGRRKKVNYGQRDY